MNYLKFYLIFLIITPLSVFSQSPQFGVKAGYLQSAFKGTDLVESEQKFGFTFSAFSKIKFAEKFSFQPEILYASFGTKAESTDGEIVVDQIAIPLKVNYYFGKEGNANGFKVNAGPQVGFVIKDKVKSEENGIDMDLSDSLELGGGKMNTVEFGATLNLGYEFKNNIWLELGGYRGLTPIVEREDEQAYTTGGILTVGYIFN